MSALDVCLVEWLGRMGAAHASQLARRFAMPERAMRSRLLRLEQASLVRSARVLHGQPALYTATAAGLRLAGLGGMRPARVGPGAFAHARECTEAALRLELALPALRVLSDRELRLPARRLEAGGISQAAHRPDLVCLSALGTRPGVAVEVELTVKAPRRLRSIVREWARERELAGVVYWGPPSVLRAVACAVRAERAQARVSLASTEAPDELAAAVAAALLTAARGGGSTRTVPSAS